MAGVRAGALRRGVWNLDELRPGDHLCFLYQHEQELGRLLTPFLMQGLQRRELVIVIAEPGRTEQVHKWLRAAAIDPAPLLGSGQLVLLSSEDAALPAGGLDLDRLLELLSFEIEHAANIGLTTLRVSIEMSWDLTGQLLAAHEQRLGRFLASNQVLAVCQYDQRRCTPEVLLSVLAAHAQVVIGGEVMDNPYARPPAGEGRPAEELEHRLQSLDDWHDCHRRLQDSEVRYRSLVEALPNGVAEIDPEGTIVFADSAYHRMYGYEAGELVGSSVADLAASAAEGQELLRTITQIVEQQPPPAPLQLRRRRKDGELYYLQADWSYRRDANGNLLGLVTVGTDITARKEAEQQSMLANERLQHLLSATTAVIYTARVTGDYGATFITANVKSVTGWQAQEFLDSSGFWLDHVHPNDKERVTAELALLMDRGQHSFEYRFCTRDGSFIWLRDEMKLVRDRAGQPLEIVGFWIDISGQYQAMQALRRSEQRLRLITDSINEIFWITDTRSSRTIYVSPAYERIFQRPLDELYENPRSWTDAVYETDMAELLASWELQARGETTVQEYRISLPDGSMRWMESRSYPVLGDNGEVVHVASVAEDITDKKVLEERLRHAEKMDAVGQLAAGIAHDFNNHLGGIVGYGDLLLRGLSDARLISYAERIVEAASSSSELTSQLLAFARKEPHQLLAIDLHTTIEQVAGLLRRTLTRRINVRLRLTAATATIQGNPGLIEAALLNLGLNARDAMPRGGELVFTSELVDLDEGSSALPHGGSPGCFVKVAISDTGVGMDEATQRRIFEPFFTTKEMGKGTGMGLAAVYGTVRNHGGSIEVSSVPGSGTTFAVFFPLTEPPPRRTTAAGEPAATVSQARILIVDDNMIMREMLSQMLGMLGHEVTACHDGGEALELYRTAGEQFDVVVLDLDMPNMDGPETFRAMRELDPDLRAVLSSGYDMSQQASLFLQQGGRAILQKPFRLATLSQVIATALR